MEREEWATKDRKASMRKAPVRKPTVRQLVALAAALCKRADVPFPETRADASELSGSGSRRGTRLHCWTTCPRDGR